MSVRPSTIILACGGTGGHIFPAFSLAEELKKRDPQVKIVYVCGKLDIENAIFKMVEGQKVISVESAPLRGASSLLKPKFVFKVLSGFFSSLRLLRQEKVDVVVGFGGYFSFPVVLAAKFCGVPTLLHEQNVFPGKANRILARIVDAVALSYKETTAYLRAHKNQRVTGNPIRLSIEKDVRSEAMKAFEFSEDKKTILILGGSQGAESINTFFLEALDFLSTEFKSSSQVLHLCGKMSPVEAEKKCQEKGLRSKAYSFFDRMDLVYSAADFAVGRAGATFLAEIGAKGIPAILIPYPFADGHQRLNAKVFAENHRATVVEQAEMSPQKMAKLLEEFMITATQNKELKNSNISGETGARQKLADFVIDILKERKRGA